MTLTSKAREAAGVVLAGELDQGEKAKHIDHDILFEVVEARTWLFEFGETYVTMRNIEGGIQYFGLATPFRRVA